jgi:hypothetical protein
MDNLDLIQEEIRKEFPKFRLTKKSDSKLMSIINIVLKIITFGKMKTFITRYVTTIGTTVYTPLNWDEKSDITKAIILRHERVHMRQSRRYSMIVFRFLYLFVLPTVFAFFRTKFEKEAYEESMRAIVQLRGPDVLDDNARERFIRYFTSADYFWMWPFRHTMEKWYDESKDRILAVYASSEKESRHG